jgi:hypothetical protein
MEGDMSTDMPERPDDDLDQAYAQAHALVDDGRGPSASVRANVLAAAREAAAQARARIDAEQGATPPLKQVAAPVAAVGRGRSMAVNLSSWRVRSGAALCAALLVALGVWRFDESHRFDGGVQVATASLELAPAPTTPLARELPVPALAAASTPYAAPPPVVEDPIDHTPSVASAKAAPHDRDSDVVVARAEPTYRSLRAAPSAEARAEAHRPPPAAASPSREAADVATPAPAVQDALAAHSPAPAQPSTTVTITAAAAPPQLATMPPMLPSVVPRRVPVTSAAPAFAAVAPAPKPSTGDVTVASANESLQRVELTGSSIKRIDVTDAAPAGPDAAKKSNSAATGSASARQSSMPLQSAADRGDVEALKTLLADPATHVDAPDAAGRTALLHAVLAQQAAAVRLLLAAGADPGRADPAGLTPRTAAQTGANAEIAALLGLRR